MATMDKQMSIYDIVTPVPKMWDCTETCKHFGEKVDYPEWWNGKARCLLPAEGGGAKMKSVVFDNTWYSYCSMYEEK